MKSIYAVRFASKNDPEEIKVAFVYAENEYVARCHAAGAIMSCTDEFIIHGVERSSMNIFIEPKRTIMAF